MGAAWCRERAAKAQDSKSPFDRVIVKCVNQMSQSESQITQNRASHNFPSHAGVGPSSSLPPPPTAPRSNPDAGDRELAAGWQEVVLRVPDPPLQATPEKPPVAPPRKKRMNRAPLTDTTKPPVPAIRKPATPTIYLEVDTPESRQRRNKSSSTLSSDGDGANEKRLILGVESDLLRLPRRVSSSASISSHRSITSVSDATAERLDNYLKSSRSFGSLRPEDMIIEMNQAQGSDASSDSDAWAGLDDWDLGIVEHHARTGTPPLTPTSQLSERKARPRATFTLGGSSASGKEATRRKRTTDRKKKAGDVKKPIDSDDSTNVPANFKGKPTEEEVRNASKIIKPSQIPLEDFLMQSTKTSLNENRCSLKVQVPSTVVRNSSFSFDFSKGLAPPRSHSPQITLPGTPNTPRSLSRCTSPFPKQFDSVQSTTPPSSPATEHKPFAWTNEDETDISHATLLRMLNEYRSAADMIGEEDARKILNDLGIPENLAKEINAVEGERKAITPDEEVEALGKVHLKVDEKLANSSGSDRSSMTPSLNELEVALSELLEASAGKPDDDEDVDDLNAAQTNKMSDQAEPVKPPRVTSEAVAKDVKPEITITICKPEVENGIHVNEEVERGVMKIESSFVPIKQEPVHVGRQIDAKPEITITVTQEEVQGEASPPKDEVVDVNGKDVGVGIGAVEEVKTQLAPAKPMLRRSRTGDDLTKLEFQT